MHLNIRQKIVFYVYLVISPILILITTFILITNYNDTKNQQIEADKNVVRSLDNSINVIQTEITDLSVYICINSDIRKILRSSETERLNENPRIWYTEAPMQIIQDIIAIKGYIKTTAIYPENGGTPYLRCMDSSVQLPDIEAVRQTQGYREALAKKGDVSWHRVNRGEKEIYQTSYSDKIVMSRVIYDASKGAARGYLVIGMNADKYTDLCKNAIHKENEGILILNSEGEELTRYGAVNEEIAAYISGEEYLSKDYREREEYFTYDSYRVFCSSLQKNGVIVCKMVPKKNVDKQLYSIILMPILILIGMLAALWPLLRLVSHILSSPLQNLRIAMKEFQNGDFDRQIEVKSKDEIGEVTACFNQMVLSIKELVERNYVMALKEKESELTALQAQINPHFLYNTLDSLYWKAQEYGNEELGEDILALSQLFRMVLGQGKGVIPVSMEQELISNYLHIQKMRFSKRLNYEIKMDEEIQEEMIPKLILQPFVENAIVHGFENSQNSGMIRITGRAAGDYLEFQVSDNGIGMSEEQINAIWNMEDSKRYSGQRVGRYAIRNVRERLELKYKQDFELTVDSCPGKGTTVTIRIPREGGRRDGIKTAGSR